MDKKKQGPGKGKNLEESFGARRWAQGQPDGRTNDGVPIVLVAYAVMDASGKWRDEDYHSE
jgi:endo-1,4-beta-D-glucanase Y